MTFAVVAVPVVETGCAAHVVTLEQGGAYSDPYLATTDQSILDASHALDGFLAWYGQNAPFLSKYPDVGKLAVKVYDHRDEWVKNAYAARDAYASAAAAYRAGKAGPPSVAAVNAALSVLLDITKQVASYKALHP